MTTANEAVATEIRAQLARQRMSQAGLAERVGKARPWVSRRMNELANFTIGDIAEIAAALDVTTIELVRSVDLARSVPVPRARARASARRQDSERAS